jgi:Tat protein translocase TatB subunit
MDILGIGFPELLLILIIAMMVFGPRRLPEIAAKLGKFIGDLRNMSSGLMTEWQREIAVATRLEELEKTRQEFDEIKEEIQHTRKNLAGEASSSMKELDKAREEVEKEVKSLPESASEDKSARTISPSKKQPAIAASSPATEATAADDPAETDSVKEPDEAGTEGEEGPESIIEAGSEEEGPVENSSSSEQPADSKASPGLEEVDNTPRPAAPQRPSGNNHKSADSQGQTASPTPSPAEAVNE